MVHRIQIKIKQMHYLSLAMIILPLNYSNLLHFGQCSWKIVKFTKLFILLGLLHILALTHSLPHNPAPPSSPSSSFPKQLQQPLIIKSFIIQFTQPTTTTFSKILTLSSCSISIYNPLTLQIGIIKFNTTSTPIMLALSPVVINSPFIIYRFLSGNFMYNRYAAQGNTSRQVYTIVGQQFYDGYTGVYTGMPKLWIVTEGEYIIKLDNNNVLWVTHWKNVRYLKVCNVSLINNNMNVTAIMSQTRNRIYLVCVNQIVLFVYNQTIQNYTMYSSSSNMPLNTNTSFISTLTLQQNSLSSTQTSYMYQHIRTSLSQISILKYQVLTNPSNYTHQFQLIQNYTIQSIIDINKISYSQNYNNFIILFNNCSIRICGFSWPQCYHLNGMPTSMIHINMDTTDYLVSQFQIRNITHFVVMTMSLKLMIYSTLQFSSSAYISTVQWPQGIIQSQPLSIPLLITTNQSYPTFKYDEPDTTQLQQQFTTLSTTTIVLVYIISIPQARNIVMFMNPLYLLLDNFWFYNYQNVQFGAVINRTFTILRIMNQVKLFPLPFYSLQNTVKQSINLNYVTKSDYTLISPQKFVNIQGNDVNFLKNVQDILIWNTLYQLFGYLLFKILLKLPLLKPGLLRTFILRRCHCGLLIISIIQCNVQFYTFMGFTQLKVMGLMEFGDKIKNIVAIAVVFIVFLYSFAAFMVMKALFCNFWNVFIQDSKYGKRSIFFTTIWLALQNLLTGMANGLFQQNLYYLKFIIIGIDISSIICLIFFWTTAKSYISNSMTFLYLSFKLSFDIVIYTQNYQNWMESLLIGGIITTVFYSIFWNIFITYRETVSHFQVNKNNNKGEKVFQTKTVIATSHHFNNNDSNNVNDGTEQRPKQYVQYQGDQNRQIQREGQFAGVKQIHSVKQISLTIIQGNNKSTKCDQTKQINIKNKRKTIIKSSEHFQQNKNLIQFLSQRYKIFAHGANFMSKVINFVDEKQINSQNSSNKTKMKQNGSQKTKQKTGKKIKFNLQNQCTSGVISQNNEIALQKSTKTVKKQQNTQKSATSIIISQRNKDPAQK